MRLVSDEVIAALNIWMEARGETFRGKIAVGEVIRNRMKLKTWGSTAAEVILAPFQFSGWNTQDRNRIKALTLDEQDKTYQLCLEAWGLSASTNYTGGATHYYNPKVVPKPPVWVGEMDLTCEIGRHVFFRSLRRDGK